MSQLLQSVYNMFPAPIQNALLSSYSIYINYERYGGKFRRKCQEFETNQWLSYEELVEYQNRRLRNLIVHVYKNVPYYESIMSKERITPNDINKVEDLKKLPVLTRDDVKKNFHQLIAKNLGHVSRFRLVKGHTSGTTGSPLEFYWDINTCVVNNVVDWRQKSWAGIHMHERCAVLLGRTIVPIGRNKPPFWRTNHIHKTLWLSSFHMTNETLPLYLKKLREYCPAYIEGYPSTLYILAKFLKSRNESFPLKAVFSSSETLHPVQRELIEEIFRAKLFDFYGLAERVVFATECNAHSGHHLNMDYGITEIVNEDGEPVGPGKLGWIVGTGLHNYAMPLIRYKANDITSIKENPCSCGRNFPLIEDVTTKAEDIITTTDGRFISASVLTHPFKPMVNIMESQIIQEDISHITIKIVRSPAYRNEDTWELLNALKERVGQDMKIEVEFVEKIEKSANGKFRWVISKVPLRIQ